MNESGSLSGMQNLGCGEQLEVLVERQGVGLCEKAGTARLSYCRSVGISRLRKEGSEFRLAGAEIPINNQPCQLYFVTVTS